jgi:ATP-dependent RNA circularization protein (DNA/RNA ligase family)
MSEVEKQLKQKFSIKSVVVDTVMNGYLVRVMEMPDIRNPAKDEQRAYVCKDGKELLELFKAIFGIE